MAAISTDTWTALGTIGLALVAFAALLVEPIRRWTRRPELTVGAISSERPNFLRIKANITAHVSLIGSSGDKEMNPSGLTTTFAYYIQLHIGNKRGRWQGWWQRDPAEDVEVYMESIKKLEDRQYVPYPLILPQNLCWAYMEGAGEKAFYYPKIPAGSKRPCSLCGFSHVASKESPPRVSLNTTIRMVSQEAHTITPGTYQIEFTISAKNAKPINRFLWLEFSGEWYDDSEDMWGKGLSATIHDT